MAISLWGLHAATSSAFAMVRSEPETKVLCLITNGQVADLGQVGNSAAGSQISGEFLAEIVQLPNSGCPKHVIALVNATVVGDVNLGAVEVANSIYLTNCQFKGIVDFRKARFQRDVVIANSADQCSILDFTQPVDLSKATVEGDVIFDNVRFGQASRFDRLEVKKELSLINAEFLGRADFNGLKVQQSADLTHCHFKGPASFMGAAVSESLDLHEATFDNVSFNGIRVGTIADFQKSRFTGAADFQGMDVGCQLQAQGIRFLNPTNRVLFVGATIGAQGMHFSSAVFRGPADFRNLRCKGNAIFLAAHFMNRAVADAMAGHTGNPANFFNADFRNISVEGTANFASAWFRGRVCLRDAVFQNIDFSVRTWPDTQDSVELGGMAFHTISAGTNAALTWEDLRYMIQPSPYRKSVYMGLETFFRQQGQNEQADLVLYEMNAAERKRAWEERGLRALPSICGNFLLRVLVGYGHHPENALGFGSAFVLFGWWLFHGTRADGTPVKMEKQKQRDSDRVYSAFWYSLDLFAPGIDLQAANHWKPREDFGFLRHYVRLHRILGWVLVPIGLAAMAGIIK